MNLLLDTNIFLEVLLQQKQASEAEKLLSSNEQHSFFMTDFSLHSIGVLLFRRRDFDAFSSFVKDLDVAGIRIVSLYPRDISVLTGNAIRYNLDFDDVYQYEIAKRFNLTLVSFDSDFDRTDMKRVTPHDVLTIG